MMIKSRLDFPPFWVKPCFVVKSKFKNIHILWKNPFNFDQKYLNTGLETQNKLSITCELWPVNDSFAGRSQEALIDIYIIGSPNEAPILRKLSLFNNKYFLLGGLLGASWGLHSKLALMGHTLYLILTNIKSFLTKPHKKITKTYSLKCQA